MFGNINTVFSAFIIVVCLIFSWFLLTTDILKPQMVGTKRTIFVVILLIYAAYRGFRLYKDFKASRHEKD